MISVPRRRFLLNRRRRAGAGEWAGAPGEGGEEAVAEPHDDEAAARRGGGGERADERVGWSPSSTDGEWSDSQRNDGQGTGGEVSDAELSDGERAFLGPLGTSAGPEFSGRHGTSAGPEFSGRHGTSAGRVGWAVLGAFGLAFFQGDADPPPKARRLAFGVPQWLRPLVPITTISLVQVAELILALLLYLQTQSTVRSWISAPPPAPDGRGPIWDGFVYLTAVAVALPIALRDRWPLAAWRVSIALMPVAVGVTRTVGFSDGGMPYTTWLIISHLLVLYSVAVRCDRRITVAVWVVMFLATWIIDPDSMPVTMVVVSVAVLFGYNVRVRRSATAKLKTEERRTRQAESAQAVLAERARIARELHDVVAHHMSVIAIQAEAVPLKARGDPAQLEAGLAEIRGLSLEAIAELRQVLGVLRDQDGRVDTAPQPGLDRLDELVSNARAAGLAVLVERAGPLDRLPPAVGLSAYRIVQESLSNAMRHAPGSTVTLDVAHRRGELRLRVANGPSAAPGAGPGAGQGVVGMRERATLLGGTLDAGPVAGGGFEVRATLPVTDAGEEAHEHS
ncbi:sensor histidine kinase [Nonomuraea jabiensis]|uniref:histidine kinase n=1 Tax=Nonomuraea jabiensis TaxID=882448 RepID=A0A7W9GAA1_9ACTN|nr:histidine kinase [Nonomuraea jabiensis]MBB5780076.1 signal transduction histidine kinase [Nonomuraea jabiensis]